MGEQVVTLVVLSYEKAQILKTLLEANNIECFLGNANVIQGAVSAGVKVKISDRDLDQAMQVLESMMKGEKVRSEEKKEPVEPRILLPVDFSSYSEKAAEVALGWAAKLKAEITLLHTFFNPVVTTIPFSDTFAYDMNLDETVMELEERAKEGMKKMEAFFEKKNNALGENKVVYKTKLLRGVAEDEIVRYSNEYQPIAIVMGTRGLDRKVSDLVGSVTAEVMENAKFPVLAVPEDFEFKGIDAMENLLYATDFQESDFIAMEILEKVVRPLGIKIICAHVSSHKHSHWDDVKIAGLQEFLSKKYPNTGVVCDLIENEDFYVGIESYVKEKKIDILSFTRKKRSLLSRLINPNVAKKMLFHSTTPLLVFNH